MFKAFLFSGTDFVICSLFVASLTSPSVVFAKENSSHSHASGKIGIAIEGKNAKINFHAPAMAIYGFEYSARSAKDKKAKDAGLQKVEDKIAEMIVFDPSVKCEIKKDMYEVDQRENHADVEFEFRVNCEKTAVGTNVIFNITKFFPRLKAVQVDVMGDGVQKSLEVQKNGDSIELK